MAIVGIVLTLIILVVIACQLYIIRLGKAEPVFDGEHRTAFRAVSLGERSMTVQCEMMYRNTGRLMYTIMDCYPRVLLPQEQFGDVRITGRVEREDARRSDGYFESVIVYPKMGGTLIVTLELEMQNEAAFDTLCKMPDVNIDIVYQIVDRHKLYIGKTRIVLTAREVRSAIEVKGAADSDG